MAWFRSVLARSTAFLCSLTTISCSNMSDEERVRRTFQNYMAAWEKGDTGSVWALMSPRLKRGNDNDSKKFEDYVRRQGLKPSGYRIGQVSTAGESAHISASISYSDLRGHKAGEEQENCQFIRAGDQWYFDDCKPSSVDG